jgi:transcriptional regulator with XRE-family HTH domain
MPRRPAPEPAAELGHAIRARRHELGWSLEELAHRAGLSRNYLSLIELGQADPSFSAVVRILRSLSMDLPEIGRAQ